MQAYYLVGRDNDLLDLMKWEKEEGHTFQRRFRCLKIVTRVEFFEGNEEARGIELAVID